MELYTIPAGAQPPPPNHHDIPASIAARPSPETYTDATFNQQISAIIVSSLAPVLEHIAYLNNTILELKTVLLGETLFKPGQMCRGFLLKKLLGKGGFGEVWLATPEGDNKDDVALKIVRSGFVTDESTNLKRLASIGVSPGVRHHLNSDENHHFGIIAMDKIDGVLLSQALPYGPDKFRVFVNISQALLRTISILELNELAHGDVKAENVFYSADGSAILIDAGGAVALRDSKVPRQLTKEFAAPEVLRGELSPKSDVFSAALTLKNLWGADDLPTEAEKILAQCLVPEPDKRMSALEASKKFKRLQYSISHKGSKLSWTSLFLVFGLGFVAAVAILSDWGVYAKNF